jgi:hypothetical protein
MSESSVIVIGDSEDEDEETNTHNNNENNNNNTLDESTQEKMSKLILIKDWILKEPDILKMGSHGAYAYILGLECVQNYLEGNSNENTIYSCHLCSYRTNSCLELDQHLTDPHNKSSMLNLNEQKRHPAFKCNFCDNYETMNCSSYVYHLRHIHNRKWLPELPQCEYTCPHCEYEVNKKQHQFKIHMSNNCRFRPTQSDPNSWTCPSSQGTSNHIKRAIQAPTTHDCLSYEFLFDRPPWPAIFLSSWSVSPAWVQHPSVLNDLADLETLVNRRKAKKVINNDSIIYPSLMLNLPQYRQLSGQNIPSEAKNSKLSPSHSNNKPAAVQKSKKIISILESKEEQETTDNKMNESNNLSQDSLDSSLLVDISAFNENNSNTNHNPKWISSQVNGFNNINNVVSPTNDSTNKFPVKLPELLINKKPVSIVNSQSNNLVKKEPSMTKCPFCSTSFTGFNQSKDVTVHIEANHRSSDTKSVKSAKISEIIESPNFKIIEPPLLEPKIPQTSTIDNEILKKNSKKISDLISLSRKRQVRKRSHQSDLLKVSNFINNSINADISAAKKLKINQISAQPSIQMKISTKEIDCIPVTLPLSLPTEPCKKKKTFFFDFEI